MNKPDKLPFESMYEVRGLAKKRTHPAPRPHAIFPGTIRPDSNDKNSEDTNTDVPANPGCLKKITWARLCKLYELNERLMDDALQRLHAEPLLYRPFQLTRRPGQPAAGARILALGRFFSHIAGLGGRDRTRRRVRACNRWLFYIRLCEGVALTNTDTEFAHLQMLYAARKFGALRAALRQYHDRRFKSLPCVMKLI